MALLEQVFLWLIAFYFVLLTEGHADSSKMSNSLKPVWNATSTDRLKHDILMHYDKFARPSQHYNTTTVSIGIAIIHVEINELKNTFTVHCWVRFSWKDDKLKWNASDYEELATLHLADHEIWQPDVVPYNSAAGSTIDHYANTHCLVTSDGTVLWVPPAQFVVFCQMDLRLWPFDTQNCFIKLGSWTYHGYAVDLKLDDPSSTDISLLIQNNEWDLLSVRRERHSKIYDCCPEPYIDITFNMTLKRRSPTYKAIVITPAVAIIILSLLNFWLPPQAGEKIFLNGCTAIIICIFLLYFTQKCPAMGDHTPYIVLFFSSSLYVVCFSMITSVCVIWLSRTQHCRPLPWIIKHPLTGWLGYWLGLSSYVNQAITGGTTNDHTRSGISCHAGEELREQHPATVSGGAGTMFDEHSGTVDLDSDEHHMIAPTTRSTYRQNDWILLAAAIDRISFIFYSLLFAILAITYSV